MLRAKWLAVVAATPVVAAAVYWSGNRTLCRGFLPENDLRIPVGDVHALGISEAQFNAVLDQVEQVYAPIIAAKGGKLVVNRLWENDTVNASANQSWGTWYINMYGGLARHAAVTADGFALVACHEIGHHIGGYPKMSWATNEGGADYFATLKCLRRLFPAGQGGGEVDRVAGGACEGAFGGDNDRTQCGRGAMSGHSIAALFQALRPGTPAPKFDTPDPAVVDRTDNRHPKAQCRLDTYFHGALCPKGAGDELSDGDPRAGACERVDGYKTGVRPLCWYKPPAGAAEERFVASESLPDAKSLRERISALGKALGGA